jgi:hypothetical protein
MMAAVPVHPPAVTMAAPAATANHHHLQTLAAAAVHTTTTTTPQHPSAPSLPSAYTYATSTSDPNPTTSYLGSNTDSSNLQNVQSSGHLNPSATPASVIDPNLETSVASEQDENNSNDYQHDSPAAEEPSKELTDADIQLAYELRRFRSE